MKEARRGRRCTGLLKLTSNREEEVLPVPSFGAGRRSAPCDDLNIHSARSKNSQFFAVQQCMNCISLRRLALTPALG
jgi:hypothetical protein